MARYLIRESAPEWRDYVWEVDAGSTRQAIDLYRSGKAELADDYKQGEFSADIESMDPVEVSVWTEGESGNSDETPLP